MSGSSQKFIARNRAPRVQIEYDVELYGSNKKMQIPFVMGVMATVNLSANSPDDSMVLLNPSFNKLAAALIPDIARFAPSIDLKTDDNPSPFSCASTSL